MTNQEAKTLSEIFGVDSFTGSTPVTLYSLLVETHGVA